MGKAVLRLAAVGLVLGSIGAGALGCAYGGVGASGDKAVVLRNDAFLFGALRKAFVCKITDAGLSGCTEGDSP